MQRLILWLLRLVSPVVTIDGLEIVRADNSAVPEVLEGISGALELIGRVDRQRLRRIQHDVLRIYVTANNAPRYCHAGRAILIKSEHALTWSESALAIIIAHEATHARIEGTGMRNKSRNIERIERICVKQSIIFANHLPDAEILVLWIKESLATRWWDADASRKRSTEALRAAGLPEWLAKLVGKISNSATRW